MGNSVQYLNLCYWKFCEIVGGGFPSQSVYVRRGRTSAHFQRHYHTHNTGENQTVREVRKMAFFFKIQFHFITEQNAVVEKMCLVHNRYIFLQVKLHIFWEGHKILQNLHQLFDWQYIGQIIGGDFAKFCGLLRKYELYFWC